MKDWLYYTPTVIESSIVKTKDENSLLMAQNLQVTGDKDITIKHEAFMFTVLKELEINGLNVQVKLKRTSILLNSSWMKMHVYTNSYIGMHPSLHIASSTNIVKANNLSTDYKIFTFQVKEFLNKESFILTGNNPYCWIVFESYPADGEAADGNMIINTGSGVQTYCASIQADIWDKINYTPWYKIFITKYAYQKVDREQYDFLKTPLSEFYKFMIRPTQKWMLSEAYLGRLDLASYEIYKDSHYWWVLALVNNIYDPFDFSLVGSIIECPDIIDITNFLTWMRQNNHK